MTKSEQAKNQPRGQPGNKGQFVKKAVMQATTPTAPPVNLDDNTPTVTVLPTDMRNDKVTEDDFDLLPDEARQKIDVISGSGKLATRPRLRTQRVMQVNAADLLNAATAEGREFGFTMSFKDGQGAPESRIVTPDKGYCVGIEGTDLHLSPEILGPRGEPSDEAIAVIQAWLEHLKPVLENADVWIGGWRPPDEDGSGKRSSLEINLTLVYHPEEKEAAMKAAKEWNQMAIWSLHEEDEIDTEGKGGQSWYTKNLSGAYKKARERGSNISPNTSPGSDQ